jgi:protein-tyrosine sulfotransferase
MAEPAIFIHGISPRAGTNYLRWLLACHADIEASRRHVWVFPHLANGRGMLEYADRLLMSPKVPGLDRASVLAALGSGLLRLLREDLDPDVSVLVKEPSVEGIEHFFEFFPSASLVLLVRDGRDVTSSLTRTKFGDFPIRRHRRWAARLGFASPLGEHARRWTAASRAIADVASRPGAWTEQCTVLRYEDLVSDRDVQVHRLLERLGLDPARLDWEAVRSLPIKGSSFVGIEDPRKGLNWKGVDADHVDLGSVGRWRKWSLRDLADFESIAGPELRRWGYELHV